MAEAGTVGEEVGEDAREPRALTLLHDSAWDAGMLEGADPDIAVTCVPWAERESIPDEAAVLLYLGDEQIRDLTSLALQRRWQIGLLPHPEGREAATALGVRGEVRSLVSHYAQAPVIAVDAVTCNGELVFSSVVIGRVLSLRPYDINRPQTVWSQFTGALKGLGKLGLRNYRITTAKEQTIQFAALGLVAVGQTQSSLVGKRFDENLAVADGRVSLLALAPRSIASYLKFMVRLLLPRKISLSKLPSSLGLIQSERLHLEAPEGMEYLLDGKPVHAGEIELQVLEGRLSLLPGPALQLRPETPQSSGKDTVRLNHIPEDEGALALADHSLPLFPHATEEEYRGLFTALRENTTPSSSYQVLMVLSVMLALTGLYANSAPVIIGAMILAPLMAPIITLAMGLARSEPNLIRGAVYTLGIGVAWGLGCAVLLAWAMPLDIPTPEMKARMSPTLLDLLVAVVSGMAGAYAHAKEEIAKSLAGVAIAVALVPPLSVAGIGLGWGEWEMARGALLLLITNLVGIALAASATFLILGFAPFKRARKGLGITLLLVLIISAPLSVAFAHLVQQGRIQEQVPRGSLTLAGQVVEVGQVSVRVGEPHLVRVTLSSPRQLEALHVDALKQIISERVGEPVELEAQLNIRR